MLRITAIPLSNDKPVTESSCAPARRAATTSYHLTKPNEESQDPSEEPWYSQWSATIAHPTPEEDDALSVLEDFDMELEYLRCKDSHL